MTNRHDNDPAPPRRPKPTLDTRLAQARAQDAWRRGEAGDLAWLDRAHRLAPADQNLRFQLAFRRLQSGDAAGAAPLFEDMAHRFNIRECWSGLAACLLALGRDAAARAATHTALSRFEADPGLIRLAARVAGEGGWCGLRADGVLLTSLPRNPGLQLLLDGVPATAAPCAANGLRLPDTWREAASLEVRAGSHAPLGSPIDLAAIRRVEGFAERHGDQVSGHAWQPAAPGQDPELRMLSDTGAELARITATEPRDQIDGAVPLARPRAFSWEAPAGLTIRVVGPDGRDLLGSPLPAATPDALPPSRPELVRTPDAALPTDIIIPVHRGLRETLACIHSVLATIAAPDRVVAINDASPEPALAAALARLAEDGRIILLHTQPGARGFPAAVNTGLRAAAGRHAVLLNSDTLVAPFWLDRLRDAACSAPDIGTATPLSNEASIFSYPDAAGGNPAPDLEATQDLAALAAEANAGRLVDVPTAHGFCMFLRADCLAETGLFDEATFAQGYGEENDFSERARALGWRHVAVPSVFVAHLGGVSFGGARLDLLQRNLAIVEARHPEYRARVAAFFAADGLASARRRLDAARWLARPRQDGGSVLLITHGMGGGTARIVAERAAAIRAQGHAPVVLRATDGLCEIGGDTGGFPNLAYALPRELGPLARLLRPGRPVRAELHHLLGHDHSVMRLLATLGIPYDVWVHDYGWFCARLSFVTGEGRFCGEADTRQCNTCLAEWGRGIDDPVSPASLRRRSAADFRRAASVIVPSQDVARRVARHVPGLVPVVRAWEADPPFAPPAPAPRTGLLRIAVVGAIGLEKGAHILLACARDAADRGLDLFFTVIGYTSDDDALLATGRVFITGEFTRAEAAALIRAQGAHMAFLPSVWPETWCYALTDIWQAGLSAAVFDIGTPAERVRAHGRGWVLPLGLPPARLNDAFLRLSGTS